MEEVRQEEQVRFRRVRGAELVLEMPAVRLQRP